MNTNARGRGPAGSGKATMPGGGLVARRLSEPERLLRSERTIVSTRWAASAFALVQVLTYYRPYPAGTFSLAIALVAVLFVGNLAFWRATRVVVGEVAIRRLAVISLLFDAAVILSLVFLYTFDAETAIWAVIYILPLVGAIRFGLRGALLAMAGATAIYAGREVYGHAEFGNDLLLTSISFRMGIGFVIAGVAGAMATRLVRDRRDLEVASDAYESVLAALSRLGQGFVVAGPRGTVYVNEALTSITGYGTDELMGMPSILDLAVPEDRPQITERIEACQRDGARGHFETSILRRDGKPVDLEVALTRLRLGQEVTVLAVLRDVTRRKQTEIEMASAFEKEREAVRRLQELDELKSDFLSTVSHELKTPLTAIGGFSATLLRWWSSLDEEKRLDFVRRIQASAQELGHLISELLDFGRLERGQLRLELEHCELLPQIQRSAGRLGALLSDHRVHLDVPAGLRARADPEALSRIVENLLSNAAKFSPGGSRVTVRARARSDEVVIAVEDEGIGIPDDELGRVFERFYRVDRRSTGPEGTGIGLAIVKQFTEAQGGRVWVTSGEGKGSVFCFTLRQAAVDEAEPAGRTRR